MLFKRFVRSLSFRFAAVALAVLGAASCQSPDKKDFLDPSNQLPNANILQAVVVAPKVVSGFTGEAVHFAAYGRNTRGDSIPVEVEWSATGGTIAPDGTYSPTADGEYTVTAVAKGNGAMRDSAAVTARHRLVATAILATPDVGELLTGESKQFTARVYYDDGSSSTEGVVWSATSGTITAAGLYTAPVEAGPMAVIAAAPGVADTLRLDVLPHPPKLTQFILNPRTLTITPGGARQFTVAASWSDGSSKLPQVTFSSTGGTIGGDGAFVATSGPGTYYVIATSPENAVADTSVVTIAPPADVALRVQPAALTLEVGASYQLSATVTKADGTQKTVNPTWSATGGTITPAGVFVAGTSAGTFHVVADFAGGLSDTASITVVNRIPVISKVLVLPADTTVAAGDVAQYQASVKLTDGSSAQAEVVWSATGGSITPSGQFTAGNVPGSFAVIASTAVRKDTTRVTIGSPTLKSVALSPAQVSTQVKDTVQFSVSARWSDGSTSVPAVTWTATGGTVSPAGRFIAGDKAGTFLVIARAGTKADTSLVQVAARQAVLTSLSLVPASATLAVGGTKQFAVSGTWSTGTTTAPSVVYTATGGTVTAGGLYTAGGVAGVYKLIARHSSGTLADTAVITIGEPKVARFLLTPDSVKVSPTGSQQFTAAAVWTDGVSRPVTVNYSASGGAMSTTGLYKAGNTVGSFLVVAACGCGAADSSIVKVVTPGVPPSLTAIAISPKATTIQTGGTQQFVVTAQWTDGSTTVPQINYSATGGSVSSGGLYTAGATAGTYQVIAQAAGATQADTATVTVSSAAPPPPPPPPPPGPLPVTLPAPVTALMGPLTAASATPAQFAQYESDFVKYEAQRWIADSTGGGASGTGCAARGYDNTNYYDRAFALYQMWARTGNQTFRNHADAVAKCYRDGYVAANGFNLQMHQWQFEGLAVHYFLTGDIQSRDAVLRVVGRDYMLAPASALTSENYLYWEGRIQARTLTGVLLAMQLGDNSKNWGAVADSLVQRIGALQHPDGSYCFPSFLNSGQGCQANYMVGMLNNALAMYYRLRKQDPAVLTIVKKSLDYLWSTQWCGQGFNYTNKAACVNTSGASDLTGLTVFGWAFYAWASGDLSYQAIGDQIFAAGIKGAYLTGQKQFNQQYRETALYLGMRH